MNLGFLYKKTKKGGNTIGTTSYIKIRLTYFTFSTMALKDSKS